MPIEAVTALALTLLLPAAPPQVTPPPAAQGAAVPLVWQRSWKSACELAAAERKPILVFVLSDSEPICHKMMDKVVTDPDAVKKLANFVLAVGSPSTHELVSGKSGSPGEKTCARYTGVLCTEHQAIEVALRSHFLDPATGGVIIPQFGVFNAEGKLLLKREYAMKRDGFLEFLASALAAAGSPAIVHPADVARSPAIARMVDAILGAKSDEEREVAAVELFADSSPEREIALQEVLSRLKSDAERCVILRAAGHPEQKAWAPAIALRLGEKDVLLRNSVVVTLEEERNPTVVDELLEAWRSEKDPEIRKDLLRALGPCGGENEEAKRLLLEELKSGKERHRIAAAVSLGSLLSGREDVAAALKASWEKESRGAVRVAILWGIGESEDAKQAPLVEQLKFGPKDDELARLAEVVKVRLRSNRKQAVKSLGKGGGATLLRLLAPIYEEDRIKRNFLRGDGDPGAPH